MLMGTSYVLTMHQQQGCVFGQCTKQKAKQLLLLYNRTHVSVIDYLTVRCVTFLYQKTENVSHIKCLQIAYCILHASINSDSCSQYVCCTYSQIFICLRSI